MNLLSQVQGWPWHLDTLEAVHRCPDNFAEMVAVGWLGLSRTAPGNSDILMINTLVLTDYTEENFDTWIIATLAWV